MNCKPFGLRCRYYSITRCLQRNSRALAQFTSKTIHAEGNSLFYNCPHKSAWGAAMIALEES